MRILVIIVTYQRADWLIRCVQSIASAAHGHPDLEIRIKIAINGQDPSTESAIAAHGLPSAQAQPIWSSASIHHFEERLTPGEARNRLLKGESAEWFYFVDDDAYVLNDVFTKFKQALSCFPNAGVVGGPNLTPPSSPSFQKDLGATLSSRFGAFKTADRYRRRGSIRLCGEESLILCNLFIRADVLPLNPFPSEYFCGEENFLLRQLKRQSVVMVHSPDVLVWHERRGSFRELSRQVYRYGEGRGKALVSDSYSGQWVHMLPALFVLLGTGLLADSVLREQASVPLELLVCIYLMIAFISALRARAQGNNVLRMIGLFLIIHFTYGTGILSGALLSIKTLLPSPRRIVSKWT